ncbi:hypothetical protein ACS0TY_036120 [Phlomoides rotata]
MADLPKFIAIKPVITKTYICYEAGTETGHLYCNGVSVFDPFTKIEIEPAKNNTNSYHLRFCHSNRYWAKCKDDKWMVAISMHPEEDTTKSTCSLFTPTIHDKGVLRLTYVRTGDYVGTDSSCNCVFVGYGTSERYDFTYVDWDSLVMIPKRVAFKGDNGKFLKAQKCEGYNYLQFKSEDGNDGYSAHEVSLHHDGHIRIKSEYYNLFWRRSPNWIWGDSSDKSGNDKDTLFWPVNLDDHTIALRNAGNNHFVKRLTTEGKTNCLNAAVLGISESAKLVVEELVLKSNVYNVRYRMEDARVYDEKPYLAGIGTAINDSDTEATLTVRVAYDVTESSTFTRTHSLKGGAKTTFETGIPAIVDGKIQFSLDYTFTNAWETTTAEKKAAEGTFSIKVPPRSRAKVSYVGTHGKCSVPFSYTQKDTSSSDGKCVTSHHNDGLGIDCVKYVI